ncbi:MAG: DNA translocase FtsK, partial [Clostridia bacterium]|nr:DNA translocase FtsK [Clostridia bacterium]
MALVIFRLDSLWALLHDYLLGLFGWTAFVIPIYVGYVAWMLSKGIQSKGKAVIIQTAVTVFLMGALTNAVIFDGDVSSIGLTEYTLNAYERGAAGGGWFAAFISWLVTFALTKTGSIIVFIVAIAVMLMLITKFTVDKLIKKVSKPVKRLGQEVKEACEGIKRYGEEEQTHEPKRHTEQDDEFIPDIDVPLDDENHKNKRERQKRSRREELERKRNKLHETYQQGMSGNEPHPLDIPLDSDEAIKEEHPDEPSEIPAQTVVVEAEPQKEELKQTEEKPAPEKIKSSIVVEAETQYNYPPISLLEKATAGESMGEIDLKVNADKLVETLSSFGVQTKVVDISRGPSVTRYELQPAPGVRVSKITGLADDIALNLAANGVRIEAPIPGKAAVGIELPNKNKSIVKLREIVESKDFLLAKSKLTFAVGKDLAGKCITADIDKMPHLLIAGATCSGKSVCINALITSLLFK